MATYDCDAPARSLVAVGGGDATMFAAGTQTIRGGNAIHIVSHDRDRDVVDIRHLGGADAQVAKRSDRFWKREWFHDPARDGTRMGYHADGIRQKSASFAAMTADWEDAVRRRRSLEKPQTDGKKPNSNSPHRPNPNLGT